jgi:hypothetical protein
MFGHDRLQCILENFDKRVEFCNGAVVFDSEKGSGSAPNNANVRYLGFAVLMEPWKFRDLVQHLPDKDRRESSISFLPSTISTKGWGPPTIYFERDADESGGSPRATVRVTGHEGRHRALLFEQMCREPMLVHFFPRHERARHMTYDVVTNIRNNLKGEKGSIDAVIGLNTYPRHSRGLFDYAFVGDELLSWE